ncbi:hypothetical protein M3A74_09140 [Corynebacterium appendicis]|uniref:hypothetical protein n=1 Tax=Corynebacterium appendicis TaxID=163202 RepID=UPI00223B6D50|nr:hypothetical protein [Corynebacterium appendicis]MCT1684963.1 hypothetical protein [Corynebacterium appendicis]
MTYRRCATRFTSVIIGASVLLAACGGMDSDEVPQAAPEEPAGDVEIVTVTQYNDGTVLGPDDEVQGEDEPEAVDTADTEEEHGDTGSNDDPEEDAKDEEPSDLAPGETEYIGTVEKQTTEEVLKGRPNPNPDYSKPSDRYYVLVLDEPTEITAQKAGPEPFTQVNEIISLGDNSTYFDSSDRWEPFVGKRVRLIVEKGNLNYPSDTSLPLGAISLAEDRGRVEEL